MPEHLSTKAQKIYGHWWVEEDDEVWSLYYSGTDDPDAIVHGYKCIKCPKKRPTWVNYVPDAEDTAYILAALNSYEARKAEHRALHLYLLGLVVDHEHRAPTVLEYQALVDTHDDVCAKMNEEEA